MEPQSLLTSPYASWAHFYLPHAALADLADAKIIVDHSWELPVHSQVLSLQSGVLRELFLSQKEGETEGGKAGVVVLREPFQRFSLQEVCAFLRLAFSLDSSSDAAGLDAIGLPSVRGVLRLAHTLDCPQILQRLERHIAGSLPRCTVPDLVDWVLLAEECQLDDLHSKCVLELASKLCTPPDIQYNINSMDGFAEAAQLTGLGKGTILLLLGTVLAAIKRAGPLNRHMSMRPLSRCMPEWQYILLAQQFDDRSSCRVCGARFASRSKLFEHLRSMGHESDVRVAELRPGSRPFGR